jgi:hypothetical protein
MPARYIHNPSEAPAAVLRAAGVALDENYPRPIVDHRFARERFLAVAAHHLERIKRSPRARARPRTGLDADRDKLTNGKGGRSRAGPLLQQRVSVQRGRRRRRP